MNHLLSSIRQCRLCIEQLPLEPKAIVQASSQSKILIIGQAPGLAAHNSGIPFDDKSGDRLRTWLGVKKATFYNADHFAIVPMSFCYPGRGKTGDTPPLKQCTKQWHKSLLSKLTAVKLTIILGKYASQWYVNSHAPLTDLAKEWQSLLRNNQIVLPHPSPRNNRWLKKNGWFEQQVIPELSKKVRTILTG